MWQRNIFLSVTYLLPLPLSDCFSLIQSLFLSIYTQIGVSVPLKKTIIQYFILYPGQPTTIIKLPVIYINAISRGPWDVRLLPIHM